MARYLGGPFDGQDIETAYDHLPVIRIPHPRSKVLAPKTIEHYEWDSRNSVRRHIASEPFERISPPATSEADHYYTCPHCGEAVDMRQLPQVIHHERDGHGRMGRES